MNKDALLKAVELAQGPGQCRYRDSDRKPVCVAAQYVFLTKGQEALEKLIEGMSVATEIDPSQGGQVDVGLTEEERTLLRTLQYKWDDYKLRDGVPEYRAQAAERARECMRQIVNEACP
jgi:hypothetical protein